MDNFTATANKLALNYAGTITSGRNTAYLTPDELNMLISKITQALILNRIDTLDAIKNELVETAIELTKNQDSDVEPRFTLTELKQLLKKLKVEAQAHCKTIV